MVEKVRSFCCRMAWSKGREELWCQVVFIWWVLTPNLSNTILNPLKGELHPCSLYVNWLTIGELREATQRKGPVLVFNTPNGNRLPKSTL
jgi:hypothetical protein